MHQTDKQPRPHSLLRHRLHTGEQGEGVISAAIAVLVMAFLGVAMWGAFNLIFDDAQETVHQQVDEIGQNP